MMAVRNRHAHLVELLLDAGASADLENDEGQSAMGLALLASAGDSSQLEEIRRVLGCDLADAGSPEN